MHRTIFPIMILFVACNNNEHNPAILKADTLQPISEALQEIKEAKPDSLTPKEYGNNHFRKVTVERKDKYQFLIRGRAQIFEANFSWVVEDGHNELLKGFQMTDAGAPEWGNFEFVITVQKKREKSTLTLILFESSPKDGSRQHELPITLY